MEQLSSNVYVETKYYPVVSFVVTSDGIVAVDSPMNPPEAKEWLRVIESKGELKYLINTEFHTDHIMGNTFLPGLIITSAYNKAHFLDSAKSNENVREMMLALSPESAEIAQNYALRWPDITFDERMSLEVGDTVFHLIRSPGHTKGQVVVHVPKERVVITADNIVHGAPPFFHAAVLWDWFSSLAMLESLDVDWYVPGHGTPCRKNWIPKLRGMMYGIIDEIRQARADGLSREDVQKQIQYIDRPGYFYPEYMANRMKLLQEVGIGNIYDHLDSHPARLPDSDLC